MEKGDFAGLELGPPDISIRNVEARTYFVIVLFWGGGAKGEGEADFPLHRQLDKDPLDPRTPRS